jgi:hypothetical protein
MYHQNLESKQKQEEEKNKRKRKRNKRKMTKKTNEKPRKSTSYCKEQDWKISI